MNLPDDKDLQKDENLNRDEELKKDEKPKDDQATVKQQQTDPQITELKGFVDPKEPLEVEGTDNPI